MVDVVDVVDDVVDVGKEWDWLEQCSSYPMVVLCNIHISSVLGFESQPH